VTTCCANPAYVYDPKNNEIACSTCGRVNTDETELAKILSFSERDGKHATTADHMIPASHLLVELGSDHAMRSLKNVGLAMELNNPRKKDFDGHKSVPQLKDAYCTGQLMERNGYFYTNDEGKLRFKIDYTRDTPYIKTKQRLYQLQVKRDRSPTGKVAANKELKRLYNNIVMDFLPNLIAEMSDHCASTDNEFDDEFSQESEENIDQLVDKLRLFIISSRRQNILSD